MQPHYSKYIDNMEDVDDDISDIDGDDDEEDYNDDDADDEDDDMAVDSDGDVGHADAVSHLRETQRKSNGWHENPFFQRRNGSQMIENCNDYGPETPWSLTDSKWSH